MDPGCPGTPSVHQLGRAHAHTPAIVEFSKRPSSETAKSKYNPHHIISQVDITLEHALQVSDVVISAVPSDAYKVPTRWLKDGCVCVNVAGEKNFEADVRERVSSARSEATNLAAGRGMPRHREHCD